VLRSFVVKNTILVPVRFVLVCLILTVVLAGVYVLTVLGETYDPGHLPLPGLISARIMDGLRAVYPVSVLLSVLITLFTVLRLKRFRAVALIVVFVAGTAAIVGGIRGIELLRRDSAASAPASVAVEPGFVYRFGNDFLYSDRREGVSLKDVVVYRNDKEPGFVFSPEALLDPGSGVVHLPETDEDFPVAKSDSSFAHMFVGPRVVSNLFRDVGVLSRALGRQKNPLAPSYLLLVSVTVLFVVSLWFLVRLTRWPLFNALIALGVFRLLFLLYGFLQSKVFQEFMSAVVQPAYQRFVSPGVILFISLVFVIVGLLLPPFDLWKREVDRE